MVLREITLLSVFGRILAAVVIGAIVGLERGMKNRPAGLRTYMLVSMGSCLIMLTNVYVFQATGQGDPMRLGAQVVSGIGFLGAGTIVVTRRNHIKGLTTAAGLWASAGVGLALGVGFYEAALLAGALVFLILTALQKWDKAMHKRTRTLDLYIEMSDALSLGDLIRQLREMGMDPSEIQLDRDSSLENNVRAVLVTVKSPTRQDHDILMERIRKISGVILLEEL